jgi:nicotinamide-nucleotide amidase
VRVEIVAVGTELLLGQIPDTNSQWLGERLAANGIASHYHQHVGDNHERIVSAFRIALSRSDAVIVCGGLGPTQDDITRAALAEIMGVELVRHDEIIEKIRSFFDARGRTMSQNNLLQADAPVGATIIEQVRGTAPGLICPCGDQVLYAVPGVPYEMSDMFERAILPDLLARQRADGGTAVIVSRVLRTWGASESGLAEAVAERFDALIDEEEQLVRALIASAFGDIIFGVDDESMEYAIAQRLLSRGLSLGLAESLTGGLIASRLVNVVGASRWFRGGLVSYAADVKFDLLRVTPGPVVSASAAEQMARGARALLKSDVAMAVTGVAGPDEQDGQGAGTVFVGLAIGDEVSHVQLRVPGDRTRVRSYSAIGALDALRRGLDRLG